MSKYDSNEFSDFFKSNSDSNSSNTNYNSINTNNYSSYDDNNEADDSIDSEYDRKNTYNIASEYGTDNNYNNSTTYDEDDDDYYTHQSTRYDRPSRNDSTRTNNINPEEVKMRKKLRRSKKLGTILSFVQLIVSIVFMVLLFSARKSFSALITIQVYIGIGAVLIALFLIALFMQSKRLLVKRLGKFISTVVIMICIVGCLFMKPLTTTKLGGTKKLTPAKPFVLYLSADDDFGEISTESNGRSDTNILAVVNPKTYTVLLLSTPRDAYVELIGEDIPEGNFDKLTHGGKYGKGVKDENGNWEHGYDVLMNILGNLYDVEVDHYLRLNFTGFIDLVDNLGGVTIDIPEGFSTYTYGKSYTFNEGKQTLSGEEALTYVRERKSFAQGDIQRGKNQVAVIEALVDQALSANTIANYSNIVESISMSFETDVDISSIVTLQMQIQGKRDYDGWNMVSYSVEGNTGGGYKYCYTTGSNLSVVSLDEESVDIAKQLVDMVLNGDKVTDKTADELSKASE